MSLFWRVFVLNAVVFVAGTLVLALSPATVSFPVELTEAIVLVVGLTAILLVNLFLVRLSFSPLQRLTSLMRRVDLLRPGQRLDASGPGEVRELGRVFNEMLERLEAERRESGRRALAAQEAERKRVAQELHDEVGQVLTAVLLQLSDVAARVPAELRPEILHAQEAARGSLEDVRRVARQLRPEALDDLGLPSALAALASRFTEQTGLRVRRRIEPLPPLPPETELVLYRVAQESLTNVARHAEAETVALEVTTADRVVELRIRDDGRGFASGEGDGHGIQGMRERAMLVGAELTIQSGAQRGTEVSLRIPLEPVP
jgi:two-component system sensor histidine kinase UhpB